MSTQKTEQSVPIIIKGGSQGGITPEPIEIDANSVFQITEEFQSQPDEWIASSSDFSIGYIESVMVGQMGSNYQFCQTSSMAHPLTIEFKDANNANIFVVQETAAAGGYALEFVVDAASDYFQAVDPKGESWSKSTFGTTNTAVSAVQVNDANGIPVCRLDRTEDQEIILNMEPAS